MSNNDQIDDDRAFDAVMERARSLSPDVEPERDLWPDIEAAIEAPERSAGWSFNPGSFFAQAAAVVLLIGGSSGLTWLAVKDDAPTPSTGDPVLVMPLTAERASFGGDYSLGPDFQDARRDLEARLTDELELLSPETRTTVEESLAVIRAAINEINTALAAEPDNPLLQELLLASYREELAVMRKVNGISSALMLREDI